MGATASSSSLPDVGTDLTAAGDGDDSLDEVVLCDFPECFVYKLPPRSSADGYCADAWGLDSPTVTGRLRVTAWGSTVCIVVWRKAIDNGVASSSSTAPPASSTVSRRAPLTAAPAAAGWLVVAHARWDVLVGKGGGGGLTHWLETVLDSSRYFVLRCMPPPVRVVGGGTGTGTSAGGVLRAAHVLVGIGFRERESAFGLKAAISDHTRSCERQQSVMSSTLADVAVTLADVAPPLPLLSAAAAVPVIVTAPPLRRLAAAAPSDQIRMLRPPPPPPPPPPLPHPQPLAQLQPLSSSDAADNESDFGDFSSACANN